MNKTILFTLLVLFGACQKPHQKELEAAIYCVLQEPSRIENCFEERGISTGSYKAEKKLKEFTSEEKKSLFHHSWFTESSEQHHSRKVVIRYEVE